jgi:opacity protein-like surface antigen
LGDYDANIYSVSATVTPMSRWYLTGYFSLQDTRTTSFANQDPSVQAYRGNVYTVMATTGYALDNKTDLTLEYSYSRSDNFTDNSSAGLPLGLNFQRTAVQAGISRKISKNVIARLRYGFYTYDESSTGGINNYTANLASASCTVRF